MRIISFTQDGFHEFVEWSEKDRAVSGKLKDLIKEIIRDPFKGKGKPEPLKGDLKGYWSRRINDEHRVIYEVGDNFILIIKCKGHYK
jgi:toxin YoeB